MGFLALFLLFVNPFWWALLILFAAGATRILLSRCRDTVTRFGLARIARGYLATMIGIFALSFLYSSHTFFQRIESGKLVSYAHFWSKVPGWSLYYFGIYSFWTILVLACFGVPVLMLLYRKGMASVLGFLAIFLVTPFVFISIAFLIGDPASNEWQQTHQLIHYKNTLLDFIVPSAVMAISFCIGAQVPLLRAEKPS